MTRKHHQHSSQDQYTCADPENFSGGGGWVGGVRDLFSIILLCKVEFSGWVKTPKTDPS